MTKVDIFSGFLGAGKTTLIKKLISEAYKDEKLVLIENEFGDIGVDGEFLKDSGIQVNEMNSGCICCSLVGDFGKALAEVVQKYNPDRILIEPSGVGKLSDVIMAVENLHNDELVLNGFTTVVDAKKCKMYMKNFGEFFNNQIENASAIILSHTAGLAQDKLDACVALLREHNETAEIVTTDWNELDGKLILQTMEKRAGIDAELEHLKTEMHEHHHHHEHDESCGCGCHDEEHEHHHHHEHGESCGCGCHDEEEHEHHHHHHHEGCACGHDHDADEIFDSIGLEVFKKVDRSHLAEILEEMAEGCTYGGIVRAKGMLACTDGTWVNFDMVPEQVEIREADPENIGKFVVIGTELQKDKIKALFND